MSPDTIGEPEPAPASEPTPRPAPEPASVAAPGAAPEPLAPILAIIIGAIAAMIGLLPWLATGMRLPLQNLWATQASPDEMPFTLLPYSQYSVMLIASVLIVGAGIAGLTARILGPRVNRRAAAFLALGVLIVHLAAITQTTVTVLHQSYDARPSEPALFRPTPRRYKASGDTSVSEYSRSVPVAHGSLRWIKRGRIRRLPQPYPTVSAAI